MCIDALSEFQKLFGVDASLVGTPVCGSYAVTSFFPNSLQVCYEFVMNATNNSF